MDPTIRLTAQTANGSGDIAEELRYVAIEEGIDVIVIHTPPLFNNRLNCFGHPIRTITGVDGDEDVEPKTAMAIFNDSLKYTIIPEMSNDACICLQFLTAIGEVYLIGVYCPPNISVEPYLRNLRDLLQFIGEKPVVICMDSNAISVWWSNSDSSDERGEIVEDFIIASGLCVLNRKDRLGQYKRSDYTDLTLASHNILHKFVSWEAMDDWTPGNTRTVAMEVEVRNFSRVPIDQPIYDGEDTDDDNSGSSLKTHSYLNEDGEEGYGVTDDNSDIDTRMLSNERVSVKKENKSLLEIHIDSLREQLCQTEQHLQEATDEKCRELLEVYYRKTKKHYMKVIRRFKEPNFNHAETSMYNEKSMLTVNGKRRKCNGRRKSLSNVKSKSSSRRKISTLTFEVRNENSSRDCFDFEEDAVTSFAGSTSHWEEDECMQDDILV